MPFLTNLSKKGFLLKNHFTSETSTILSTVSLLSGMNPSLLSEFSSLAKLKKILQISKERSFFTDFNHSEYTTSFFFGDTRKAFGFEKSVKSLDISYYFFREDYLKETGRKKDLDKEGNVYEKPFLKFTAKKIKAQKNPFFSIILTNQAHYPFFCSPDIKINDSVKKRTKICLRYIDEAIKNFFQEIQNSIWFNQTLFVFTSDHPNILDFTNEDAQIEKGFLFFHNVPLVFYHPKRDLKLYQNNQVSSHTDIIPSLMDYVSIPKQHSLTSNSIFQLKNKRRFFTKKAERFYLLTGDNHLTIYTCLDKNSKTYLRDSEGWKSADHKTQKRYDKLIKSYIQYEYSLKK